MPSVKIDIPGQCQCAATDSPIQFTAQIKAETTFFLGFADFAYDEEKNYRLTSKSEKLKQKSENRYRDLDSAGLGNKFISQIRG